MSEFSPSIASKSSESKGAAEDGVDNKADFQRLRDLLRQLNRSNADKTSTDRQSQQSSIQDLLAYDNDRHDQSTQALLLTQLTQQEGLPPGTFAPENPILEEVLTPDVNAVQQAAEDLELLAQMVCDRITQRLNSEMEHYGFHQSNRIFSHQTIAIHQINSAQIALSSSESEQALDVVERLAQEIEQLLHHRLVYESERRGRAGGCLPW